MAKKSYSCTFIELFFLNEGTLFLLFCTTITLISVCLEIIPNKLYNNQTTGTSTQIIICNFMSARAGYKEMWM
jgi:hypothetical protein